MIIQAFNNFIQIIYHNIMRTEIIGFTLGTLLTILGMAELVPALVDWSHDHVNANDFLLNAMICLFFGISMTLANWRFGKTITVRESFLLTTLSWLFLSLFAALPLYTSDLNISFVDAFFESISALTTTGSTVLGGLDNMSHGILLWRSMLQWIGGIGFIAFAIILLPFLRVGGMQLFQTESSDRSEKIMPKSGEIVVSLFIVYCLLTIACALTYFFLGMNAFDAVNHAMTTLSTGGFSTHDKSFGYFNDSPALVYAGSFFMLSGGIPFILFVKLIFQGKFSLFTDEQVRVAVGIVALLSLGLTLWLWQNHEYYSQHFEEAFRVTLFHIISIITTTGYATADYTTWGNFPIVFFFFLTYIGLCTGSTAGGIKTMRIVIASKAVFWQFKSILYPHGVFILRYQGKTVDQELVSTVLGFLSLFVISNVFMTGILAFIGLDFATALSGSATAMANVGPGIGKIIGPAGNFSTLPDAAKWVLCAGMILGRLEILTVFVIFTPYYWRK